MTKTEAKTAKETPRSGEALAELSSEEAKIVAAIGRENERSGEAEEAPKTFAIFMVF